LFPRKHCLFESVFQETRPSCLYILHIIIVKAECVRNCMFEGRTERNYMLVEELRGRGEHIKRVKCKKLYATGSVAGSRGAYKKRKSQEVICLRRSCRVERSI